MGSTTTLFTGLSGVLANGRMLDVVGNNIANVNSMAFKSSRILFAPTFSRTFSSGTAPGANTGGTNPKQIGLGVTVAGTQRNLNGGSIGVTGVNTDIAIQGDGYFVLDTLGERRYTRAGVFTKNSQNELVTLDGSKVLGYGVDSDFNIVPGDVDSISIPVGTMTLAVATQNVRFNGNLNASGDVGSTGTTIAMGAMSALGAANPPPANPPFADSTTRLVDLDDGSGSALFTAGDTLRLTDAEKGGKTLPDADLVITSTTTIADYMAFIEQSLGIDTSVSGEPGGVSIDDTTGVITIEGNFGTANELTIDSSDLVQLDSGGAQVGQPFAMTQSAVAAGESVRTTFVVYDSLGNPLTVDLTMALETRDDTGTTWRYYADSTDNVGGDIRVGTGTVAFDNSGQIVLPADFNLAIQRDNTGAGDPLSFTVSMASEFDNVSSLADDTSTLSAVYQDGSGIGTLTDFSIGEDGRISGSFSNGLVRTIGQVAVATFSNPAGLVDAGDNIFREGVNSGTAVVSAPLSFGAGRLVGGALELSNVDLSQEFINMILASTGYSASGRVINTANELIRELLTIGR